MERADAPAREESAVAGAARLRSVDPSRGTNQTGVRLYNERLVLSLIRRHGSLPKAEIARLTGLSAQTVTVIIRQLEADGLLVREAPQRGKVGQPLVPFSLNRDGAFSLGLKIGRRSCDLVLMDFVGGVRASLHETYPYPAPPVLMRFAGEGAAALAATLGERERSRIAGLGIAAPFELWNWEEQVGAPRAVLDAWRRFDIQREIAGICPWPVSFCNDATAACAAELTFGNPGHHLDFLYFFIGSFIGGGVVLNGSLYPGRSGNAGALGSMLVPRAEGGGGEQLIRRASLYVLENRLLAAGHDPAMLWRDPDDWGNVGPPLEEWIAEASASLALAIVSAIAVIDFQAVIIDGALPVQVRRRVVEATAAALTRLDHQGLSPVAIAEGAIGSGARGIGAACLPLLANFARDRELLFKEEM
jgi:predicted NBD/HSP70 family sugar kinase